MKQARRLAATFGALLAVLTTPSGVVSPEVIVSFPLSPLLVQAQSGEVVLGEVPQRLTISTIGLDLPVKPASYDGKTWQFYPEAVSYWVDSARMGEVGNIVIYGHRKTLFRDLMGIRLGDIAVLTTETGRRTYTVTQFRVVAPSQVDVLEPTADEQLTLLTCTNEDDTDRLILIAEPSTSFFDLL